jgi:hypothetical protein
VAAPLTADGWSGRFNLELYPREETEELLLVSAGLSVGLGSVITGYSNY